MSCSLNSLKGVIWGIIYGTTIRVTKGDTRSLDNGSYQNASSKPPYPQAKALEYPKLQVPQAPKLITKKIDVNKVLMP